MVSLAALLVAACADAPAIAAAADVAVAAGRLAGAPPARHGGGGGFVLRSRRAGARLLKAIGCLPDVVAGSPAADAAAAAAAPAGTAAVCVGLPVGLVAVNLAAGLAWLEAFSDDGGCCPARSLASRTPGRGSCAVDGRGARRCGGCENGTAEGTKAAAVGAEDEEVVLAFVLWRGWAPCPEGANCRGARAGCFSAALARARLFPEHVLP